MSGGTVGVVYVLTNPSFPDYVKIGYAADLDARLAQLNSSECVPFAFRPYATYGVTASLRDRDLHALIDRLRPDLRAVEGYRGKTRVREFYAMSAEDAYALLWGIARLSGTEDRLSLLAPSESERAAEHVALDVRAGYRERRRNFSFADFGVPDGAEIAMVGRPEVKATVLGGDRVVCEGETGELETGTLASFTRLYADLEHVRGAWRYWSYMGVPLDDMAGRPAGG